MNPWLIMVPCRLDGRAVKHDILELNKLIVTKLTSRAFWGWRLNNLTSVIHSSF